MVGPILSYYGKCTGKHNSTIKTIISAMYALNLRILSGQKIRFN
jgi:hypothetical protein